MATSDRMRPPGTKSGQKGEGNVVEIDLNADLGEGFGAWRFGEDEALLEVISSANIACGYHAGDANIMNETVRVAAAKDICIGAHIGFPDMVGFGRREISFDANSFVHHAVYQIGALAALASVHGDRVHHFNFHGALGHMIATDETLAEIMIGALSRYDPELMVSTIPGGETMRAAKRHGLRSEGSFFADRAYGPDGKLVSRKVAGSVIDDSATIADRVVRLMNEGTVQTTDGQFLPIEARSVLVHSDTPGAAAHARAIRLRVEREGGRIVPLHRL